MSTKTGHIRSHARNVFSVFMKFGGPPKGKGGGGQDRTPPPPGSVPARVGLVGVCLESVVVGVGPAGVGVMGSIHVNVTYLSYWKVYVNSPT